MTAFPCRCDAFNQGPCPKEADAEDSYCSWCREMCQRLLAQAKTNQEAEQ